MHSKLDLNLFVVLIAIYREGSITAAADHLHLTQPAVSHALGRLRSMLDDPLFERHGRRMVPTGRCHQLLPVVSQAIDTLHISALQPWSPALALTSRTISLGLRDIMEWWWLPPLQQHLCEQAPRVKTRSVPAPLDDIPTLLARGEIDVAVDALMPVSSDICQQKIVEEPFVMLCRPDHSLVRHPSLTGYTQAQHVVVSAPRSHINQVDMALAKNGRQRQVAFTCSHFLAAARLAATSNLVLTLPQAYARCIRQSVAVAVCPLPFEVPPLAVHMYWHCATQQDPLLAQVRAWLVEAAAISSATTDAPDLHQSAPSASH